MERYNLTILGFSETKVKGNGMREINGAKYVYAGVTEGRARSGVGIIVSERWGDRLRSWRCVSERCATISLKPSACGYRSYRCTPRKKIRTMGPRMLSMGNCKGW